MPPNPGASKDTTNGTHNLTVEFQNAPAGKRKHFRVTCTGQDKQKTDGMNTTSKALIQISKINANWWSCGCKWGYLGWLVGGWDGE